MEEKEINVLETMLDNLIVNVFGHKDRLLAQTDVQDVKIKSLLEAYNQTGITYPHYSEKFLGPIVEKVKQAKSDAPFFEKYQQTFEELNGLLDKLEGQDNSLELLQQAERLINDLLILLHFQWVNLSAKLPPVVKKVRAVRDTEIALIADFSARKPELKKKSNWPEIRDTFALEQQGLAAEQLELFLKEKDILDKMQVVADDRERLLKLSEELFLR